MESYQCIREAIIGGDWSDVTVSAYLDALREQDGLSLSDAVFVVARIISGRLVADRMALVARLMVDDALAARIKTAVVGIAWPPDAPLPGLDYRPGDAAPVPVWSELIVNEHNYELPGLYMVGVDWILSLPFVQEAAKQFEAA